MACISCKNQKSKQLNELKCVPYETNPKRLTSVFVFYQYKAPSISSSLSKPKPKGKCIEVFSEFIKNENIESKVIGQSAKISKALSPMNINGNHICFKCSRFVCKRKNPQDGVKEEDYESFFRHLRNSIAHGNVYCLITNNNTYLVFDDYSSSDKNALTARIVITKAQLERLKNNILGIGE